MIAILFAKYPLPGNVKTRLGKTIGMEKACSLYTEWLLSTVKEHSNRNYELLITGFPSYQLQKFKTLLKRSSLKPTSSSNLGQMMLKAVQQNLQTHSKVILIGADCPQLTHKIVTDAFYALETHDVVLGPDNGGGMYLIGTKSTSDIFSSIMYSEDTDFKQTVNLCKKKKLKAHILSVLIDIDTEEDFNNYKALNMIKR